MALAARLLSRAGHRPRPTKPGAEATA